MADTEPRLTQDVAWFYHPNGEFTVNECMFIMLSEVFVVFLPKRQMQVNYCGLPLNGALQQRQPLPCFWETMKLQFLEAMEQVVQGYQ
jgi:hypothetical protein